VYESVKYQYRNGGNSGIKKPRNNGVISMAKAMIMAKYKYQANGVISMA